MTDRVDLFGDPVPANHGGRGRRAHAPSQDLRNRIVAMLIMNLTNEEIAEQLGITQPTLRKFYKGELAKRGTARIRVQVLRMEKLIEGVRAGKVPAIKALDKVLEHQDLQAAERRVRDRGRIGDVPAEKLGKKAQRLENAKRTVAEGRFAVPPAPRLVN